MTNREKAIVMAFTGTCMLTGVDLKHYYDYCSELLGHAAYTHEIYTRKIQKLSKPDFLKLCAETTDECAVEHGHWVWVPNPIDRSRELLCTVCQEEAIVDKYGNYVQTPYCPYCGSKNEVSE